MRQAIRIPLLAVALIVVLAGTVLATGGSGFSSVLRSRGPLSGAVQYNTGAVKFQTKGIVDVAHSTTTILPGGNSGWHEHPGVLLLTVQAGTVTFYDDTCSGTIHATGTSFIEAAGDGPGLARNESTSVTAIVDVTYIVPTGAALRIDTPVAPCTLP
jgi:quercetin dioxygenase-like cupin family protein